MVLFMPNKRPSFSQALDKTKASFLKIEKNGPTKKDNTEK